MDRGPRAAPTRQRRNRRGWLALALAILGCGFEAKAQFSGSGIKYPLYYSRDELARGQTNLLKMLLIGKSVDLRPDGTFFIQQVRIEHYGPDGRTNLTAHAPDCVLDRVRSVASSGSRLELEAERGVLFLEGRGFLCNLTNMNLMLSNNIYTRIREDVAKTVRARKPGEPLAVTNSLATTNAATNYITIVSDRLLFAQSSNTVTYLDNVRVDSSQFAMTCQRLDGQRATNGTLESIVARQDVVFFNKLDGSSAFGDRADYRVEEGRETVLLTGADARWQDALRAAQAKAFTFDIKEQRLVAERQAYIRLPRSSVGQQGLLPGGPQARPKTNAVAGDLEVWAELLTVQLPTTNHPARTITASSPADSTAAGTPRQLGNAGIGGVVVTSSADNSRATGDYAKYSEATGVLEVNGHAFWQTGERIAACDELYVDRTNRVFSGSGNAYFKLPLADLGKHGALSPFVSSRTNTPATNAPQFLEMWCRDFDYRSSLLTFRENVRGRFLEGTNAIGALNCGVLQLRFDSNEVESVTARLDVHIEQFPYTSTNGTTISKSLDCQSLTALFDKEGFIRRVIAETNVVGVQLERSATNAPVASSLAAQLVVGEFFARTNRLRELVAMKRVSLAHDKNRASSDRAVYHVTNNIVELTGQPTAELPDFQGRITDAEMLTYDLARKQFYVQKGRGVGVPERPSASTTNRSNLLFPK